MHRVYQTKTGEDGDCLFACIASILEVPLHFLPYINPAQSPGPEFWRLSGAALRAHGIGLVYAKSADCAPARHHIAVLAHFDPQTGQDIEGAHAVVAQGDRLEFDPRRGMNRLRKAMVAHNPFMRIVPYWLRDGAPTIYMVQSKGTVK